MLAIYPSINCNWKKKGKHYKFMPKEKGKLWVHLYKLFGHLKITLKIFGGMRISVIKS